MRNLVRGGAILLCIGMFVALIYAQAKTEKVLSSANDSQLKLNNIDNPEVVADDKKLVKKTVSETKVVSAAASAGAISKGIFYSNCILFEGQDGNGTRSSSRYHRGRSSGSSPGIASHTWRGFLHRSVHGF
jgi:hypothetical protein